MSILSTIVCYHNEDFFVAWKPNGIPTTFGKEICFLDILMGKTSIKPIHFTIPSHLLAYIDLPDFTQTELKQSTIEQQIRTFGKEEELWLLNRLDNETAGFLYFAKNKKAHELYKKLQSTGKIHKRYIAEIKWTPKESAFEINLPIMHHKYKEDRMIVIREPKDKIKGRSKEQKTSTIVKVLHTDNTKKTTLLVGIYKGVRHQIRVHLAAIGYPVIGDVLYGKDANKGNLCLRSIGFQINK